MTQYTSLTLVPALEWGTPSGTYTGNNVYVGDAVPAANYYAGQGYIQTFLYNVANFDGTITVEATLQDIPETAAWFVVNASGNVGNTVTQITSNSVIGNFSWLRARVDFTAGNVNSVTANY